MDQIPAKTIVTKTKSSDWFGIDYNMNIYKGCCHGCIYCDSRSECYRIDNFDKVRVKENALMIIRDDLRRKVKKGVVGTGAMSDPYNPYEKELMLTRHALELIDAFGFGAAVATKGTLVIRDIDILEEIKQHSPVLLKVTVTTPRDELSKKLEPGAPSSGERLEAVHALREAGIFAGILLMPVLPFIEDEEEDIIRLVRMASEEGAKFIYPQFGMTLRSNQRIWYYDKLGKLFPGENYVEKYRKKYGGAYECRSPVWRRLWGSFVRECERFHILYDMKSIVRAYKRNYECSQITFFD